MVGDQMTHASIYVIASMFISHCIQMHCRYNNVCENDQFLVVKYFLIKENGTSITIYNTIQ